MADKHIIFTNGRSGSNFIANTLNLHPEIVNFGEVLGEWTFPYKLYIKISWLGVSSERYINSIYNSFFIYYIAQFISILSHKKTGKAINFKTRSNVKSIGVKDFSFLIKSRELENWLIKSTDIKVIYLYRENILKRYLSLVMMNQTGIVKSESSSNKRAISIDIEDMLSELSIYESQLEHERSIINRIIPKRIIELRYEDYFSNDKKMNDETNKIFEFLGVKPIKLKSSQKKLNADKLDELIDNYDDVKNALLNTNYFKHLGL